MVKQEKTEEQDEHRKLSITDTSGQKDIANLIDQSKQEQTQSSNDFTSDPNQQTKGENTSKNSVTDSKEENSNISTTGTSTQEVPISPQSDNQSVNNQVVNQNNAESDDKESSAVNNAEQHSDEPEQTKSHETEQTANHDTPVTQTITNSSSSENKGDNSQIVVKEEEPTTTQPEDEGFLNQTIFFLPNWQWLAIFVAFILILVGLILRRKKRIQDFDEDSEDIADFDSAELQALTEKIQSIENGESSSETVSSDNQDNISNEPDHQILSEETSKNFSGNVTDFENTEDKLSSELDDVFVSESGNLSDEQFTSALDDFLIDNDTDQNTSNKEFSSALDDIFADDEEISHAESRQSERASSNFDDIFLDDSQEPDDFFTKSGNSKENTHSSEEQGFDFDMNFDSQDTSEKNTTNDDKMSFSFDNPTDHQDFILESNSSSPSNLDDIFMEWDEEKNDIVEHTSSVQQKHTLDQRESHGLFKDTQQQASSGALHVIHTSQDEAHTAQDALDVRREMNISLDLASSFIVTGHGERARKWLEEVAELGDDEQRARAEKMLRDLDK